MPHLSYLTVKRNKETLPIFESPDARASGRLQYYTKLKIIIQN